MQLIFRVISIGLQVSVIQPKIVKAASIVEHLTPERCFIYENWGLISGGDPTVSVARARVKSGVTTRLHHLTDAQEIYIIIKGEGKVQLGSIEPARVAEGDVVVIPAGASQRIANIGKVDLVFYCVCTPAFMKERYVDEEAENPT